MNVLLLNQRWFADELRQAGHTVVSCGLRGEVVDVPILAPALNWEHIRSTLPSGFEPDVLLFLDESFAATIVGLEDLEIPTFFYAVDTHQHLELHRYMYELFDDTVVAQRDYIAPLEAEGCQTEWLPLWAPFFVAPSSEKTHEAVFVGTLSSTLNPDRVKFFEALKEKVDITVTTGHWFRIFPQAEIVVNQTVRGDLNFRVFEALISGATLLTERSGNGLTELFVPGEHLLLYEKGNVDECAALIRETLADKPRARKIAEAGRSEVLRAHTAAHRTNTILERLGSIKKRNSPIKNFSAMINYAVIARRSSGMDAATEQRSLIAALASAEKGLMRGEPLNDAMLTNFLRTALKYDIVANSDSGFKLTQRFVEAYEGRPLLQLGLIRGFLNRGRPAEARAIAKRLGLDDPAPIFSAAESLCQGLLKDDPTLK